MIIHDWAAMTAGSMVLDTAGTVFSAASLNLLDITINNLKWDAQRDTSKSLQASALAKLLQRSTMTCDDLLQYYKSVIRPVLEYVCMVWNDS
jgi:hypothetical protein